jgi:hypothetical protein
MLLILRMHYFAEIRSILLEFIECEKFRGLVTVLIMSAVVHYLLSEKGNKEDIKF